jgi:hypothetical protein
MADLVNRGGKDGREPSTLHLITSGMTASQNALQSAYRCVELDELPPTLGTEILKMG